MTDDTPEDPSSLELSAASGRFWAVLAVVCTVYLGCVLLLGTPVGVYAGMTAGILTALCLRSVLRRRRDRKGRQAS